MPTKKKAPVKKAPTPKVTDIEVTPEEMTEILAQVRAQKRRRDSKMPMCQKDMLAICGTAPTLMATPWEDEAFEIWAVAQCSTYPMFKRADVLWEMHTEGYWKDPPVLARINKWNGPTIMQDTYAEVPKAIRFPLEEVVTYRRYHTTSITYMLAWAYHSFMKVQKPVHVGLYGVHMEAREEYTEQRPCCEYWLGRMEGAGMSIQVAGGAVLSQNGLYGYENYDPLCWKIRQRLNGLNAGVQVRAKEEADAELKKHEQVGAVKEAEYWLRQAQTGTLYTTTTEEAKGAT